MNAKDAIRNNLELSNTMINSYINDLDDADLLVRPVEGMNHIAWQLGHLLSTEHKFVNTIKPGTSPDLPEGFEEGHGRNQFTIDDPSKYLPRAKYQELMAAQREATLKLLESTDESELDRTDPGNFPDFAPTVGLVLNLVGNHALMHVGQFVAVRRKLGKPITM